jgi:hypothetical protein
MQKDNRINTPRESGGSGKPAGNGTKRPAVDRREA